MPRSFTEWEVWKNAYDLVLQIYQHTHLFPREEKYGLTLQLRRSANAVAANIAESQGRFSYTDCIRVLYIARGEIFETRSHIRVAKGVNFIENKTFALLDSQYEQLTRSLNALIRHTGIRRQTE